MGAQQVCGGEEVLPGGLYTAAFHSFSPLTLFDCGRGREEKGEERKWKRGTGGAGGLLHSSLGHSFHFGGEGGDRKRRREEQGDRPLLACQELSHNPLSDLRRTELSLSPSSLPPPSFSQHYFTPIPANLHYSPLCPPSFFSHLSPLLLLGQRYLARLIVM